MSDAQPPVPPTDATIRASFAAVTMAFASLGRLCVALDFNFCIRHASPQLDGLLGPGAAARLLGRPAAELLGDELFAPQADLRRALEQGERREGWRGMLNLGGDRARLVAVSAAPLQRDSHGACDPGAKYLVVMRPAETIGDAPLPALGDLVARSAAMAQVVRLVENLQHSEATVLLVGESGTGKGVVARAIHDQSPRRNGPFVAVNCAALPGELLESELFGHVRGAFSGAVRDRVGRFEAAAGGTLFLDEVGDVPVVLQVKLLRVLQERAFERVGETAERRTDARIIAATNRDLRRAIDAGAFREDLYYRLRVVPIELPALRARREDIEPLARRLLGRVAARAGRELRFSPDALRCILSYAWPGNVRELENSLEYALAVCKGQTVLPEDLPVEVRTTPPPAAATDPRKDRPPQHQRPGEPDDEYHTLRRALEDNHWSRSKTASALGISRTTLWRKLRELGL